MVTKQCEICRKSMRLYPSEVKRKRFCSRRCLGVSNYRTNLRGKSGNTTPPGSPGRKRQAAKISGKNNPRWTPAVRFTCQNCGDEFFLKPWRVRAREKTGCPAKFCSHKCFCDYRKKHLSGPLAPDYVGGPRTYRGRNWPIQRARAIERDEGCCQDCGTYEGESIPVHHKRPYREFDSPERANWLSNLICLCQSCHMKREASIPQPPA